MFAKHQWCHDCQYCDIYRLKMMSLRAASVSLARLASHLLPHLFLQVRSRPMNFFRRCLSTNTPAMAAAADPIQVDIVNCHHHCHICVFLCHCVYSSFHRASSRFPSQYNLYFNSFPLSERVLLFFSWCPSRPSKKVSLFTTDFAGTLCE